MNEPKILHPQMTGFYNKKSTVVFVKSGPLIVWFGSGNWGFVMHYRQYAKLSFSYSDEKLDKLWAPLRTNWPAKGMHVHACVSACVCVWKWVCISQNEYSGSALQAITKSCQSPRLLIPKRWALTCWSYVAATPTLTTGLGIASEACWLPNPPHHHPLTHTHTAPTLAHNKGPGWRAQKTYLLNEKWRHISFTHFLFDSTKH